MAEEAPSQAAQDPAPTSEGTPVQNAPVVPPVEAMDVPRGSVPRPVPLPAAPAPKEESTTDPTRNGASHGAASRS